MSSSPRSSSTGPLTPPDESDDPWEPATLSLQDQMQHAYALDDMHLARVLLLKLRGIDVTGDDDPRIAQVRDDDFCFVPEGALALEPADEQAVRAEHERWEQARRDDRLRALGRKWEDEARRMRAAMQRRQVEDRRAEARAKRRESAMRMEARTEETMRRHLQQLSTSCSTTRPKISYASLSPTRTAQRAPAEAPCLFAHELPTVPLASSAPLASRVLPPSSPTVRRAATAHSPVRMRAVPFEVVVTSMAGPLFPSDPEERNCPRRTAAQVQLLDALLAVVHWQDGERRRVKGKENVRACVPRRTDSNLSVEEECPACSAETRASGQSESISASSSSASVSTVSRSGSWLSSFGSHRSASTALTTPATSFLSKADGSPIFSVAPRPGHRPEAGCLRLRHSYSCPRTRLTAIALSDSPLHFSDSGKVTLEAVDEEPVVTTRGASGTFTIVKRVSLSMSRVLGYATRLQDAYVRATLSTVVMHDSYAYSSRSESDSRSRSPAQSASPLPRAQLKDPGYRVRAADIGVFLDVPAEPAIDADDAPLLYILLPLPRPKPAAPAEGPVPSPLRPRAPPAQLEWRPRPIANPAALRIRALQNVCCARSLQWEGRGRAGGLSCGAERIVGVAFEGIGRSALGRQVMC